MLRNRHSLLLKQPGQVRLDLGPKELRASHWVIRALGHLGTEVLVVARQEDLEEVLKVEVAVIVGIEVLDDQVAVGLCRLLDAVLSSESHTLQAYLRNLRISTEPMTPFSSRSTRMKAA